MTELTHSGSIVINRSPEDVYDMVADVTRTGEWSPVCEECWWDESEVEGPRIGAKFTGRNVTPVRTWETRSEVVAADRGRAYLFVPKSALFQDNGQDCVWVIEEGDVVRRRRVEVAISNEDLARVESGLKYGDAVVLNPVKSLSDGEVVRVTQ